MSKLLSIGKETMKKCDLFASMQFLRFKSDAETKSLTGGGISIAIVIFLLVQFSSMIFETFGKVTITAVIDYTQEDQPPEIIYSTHDNGKTFMFGIQLWGYDLTTGPRYFDITAVNAVLIQGLYSNQSVDITLQKCTIDHWGGIADINTIFDRVGMGTWLCLPLNITFIVAGKYISAVQRSLDITVSKCNNATDPTRPCATQAEIDAFMLADSQFYWTPYFINPLINPQKEEYITYYLEDKWYVMSGLNYGSEMYFYNDDYQITTDESILPFTNTHFQNGPIVDSVFANAYDLDGTSDIYLLLNFFRAPNSRIIKRQFEKILDAFAYVGGLLGSFMLILLVTTFYNEGSYQLNFASALYQPEEGSPTTFRKYNILFYIIQGIYAVFRVFNYKLKTWKSTQFFYEARKQMGKQLDVMLLFKKLYSLEAAVKLLLTKPQLRGLMLQSQIKLTEARAIRKSYSLKVNVAKLAKHKIENRTKDKNDSDKEPGSFAKIGSVQLQYKDGIKRFSSFEDKIIIGEEKKKQQNVQDEGEEINIQDYGSDSESSGAEEDEHLKKERELLDDLYSLERDCAENNEISQRIYDNIDPRIKKLLERATQIRFQSSAKLTQPKNTIRIQEEQEFAEQSVELQSSALKKIKVSSSHDRRRVSRLQRKRSGKQIDDPNADFDFDHFDQ